MLETELSVNTGAGGLTTIVRLSLMLPSKLPFAVTVKPYEPLAVGVPVIAPLEVLKDRPGGKLPDSE
jgi:hypothetical protein